MKRYKAQGVLFSKNNYKLVDCLNKTFLKTEMHLYYSGDFFDFVSKVVDIKAELVFIDASAFDVKKFPFQLLNNSNFKEKIKIVIVSDNFVCSNPYIDVVGISKLENYILNYYNNMKDELEYKICRDFSKEIINFLLKVGVFPKYKGRDYLADCFNLILNNKFLLNQLCDNCYVRVAGKNKSKASCVERNIRWTIKYSYLKREPNVWEKIFGIEFNRVPPNKFFIGLCVDKISEILKF